MVMGIGGGSPGWRRGGLALVALALAGCEEPNTYVEPPPPAVTVAQPMIQEVTDYLEYTGTTESSERVEVPARVSGILESMHFEPGTTVGAGDVLFVIDRAVYAAEHQAAEADLAQAEAAAELAKVTAARMVEAGDAVSRTQRDEAAASARQAAAEVLVREARLQQAAIDLGYTEVVAPIRGRVGRNLVDVGNLVGEAEATVLTDVTSYDPIYVYFNMNERDLLRVMAIYRQRVADEGIDARTESLEEVGIPLELGLADEDGYPHEGVMDFAESGVDATTGTLRLRGKFANPGAVPLLLPGMFARVRMPIAERPDIPLVTERAIGADQSGAFVLVVDPENGAVEKRNVRQGQLIDGLRVIEAGVGADDWVVVNGIQRARPGGKVSPETTDMAGFKASALAAAAGGTRPAAGNGAPTAAADDEADSEADPVEQVLGAGAPDPEAGDEPAAD